MTARQERGLANEPLHCTRLIRLISPLTSSLVICEQDKDRLPSGVGQRDRQTINTREMQGFRNWKRDYVI